MNSQLTDNYKKEVSDILSKIGESLGEKVIEKIEPEIGAVSKEVINISKEVRSFKESIELTENIKIKLVSEIDLIKNEIKNDYESINNSINDIVLKELQNISIRLQNIELDNKVEIQLQEMQLHQKKVFKFLYLMLLLSFLILIMLVIGFASTN